MPDTLAGRIGQQALLHPDSPALLAPGRAPITYSRLKHELQTASAFLRQVGLEPGIPIALALPNGPENVTTFLAASAAGAVVLLNPAAPQPEIERLLLETSARLVIVPAGVDSPAVHAAQNLQAGLIELQVLEDSPASAFTLQVKIPPPPLQPSLTPEISILIFTSGTTARPKAAQITHQNVISMAEAMASFFRLTPEDRSLNLMPLFHTQGLLTSSVPALISGGSVVCTPGLDPQAFFGWLEEFHPTWLSVSPTVLYAIAGLAAAQEHKSIHSSLRFIRSSSAPLPVPLQQQIERLLDVPVYPSYGMTEAAGIICSNPLAPGLCKPGTVGLVVSGEAAILDLNGTGILPPNVVGQIALRGPAVTPGYLNQPDLNASLFQDGWLKTGDLGFFDQDGYLTITGRIKEMILRAGENISPYEIEDVLHLHPDVSQAAVFGLPDPALGEEVAAAVVLKQGFATSRELRQFVATRLASSKVPEEIIILPELPRGATGKIQRSLLAQRISQERSSSPALSGQDTPPQGEVEEFLAGLWSELLGIRQIGTHQRFLDLGGDSLLAARLAARLRQQLILEVDLVDLLEADTIAAQAVLLQKML